MFPYAHICFAGDILGKTNDEIILGAVFPDTVIAGFLEHSVSHHQSAALHRYLNGLGILTDFSQAVITHGTTPEGLDYYCDEKYLNGEKGYAFEVSRPLTEKVIKSCNLPEEMGWWKAHNFIEMAVDLWLYERRPEFQGYLKRALDNRTMILAISHVLSPFFDIPVGKLAMSFPVYGEHVLTDEVTPEGLADKYAMQTAKRHGIEIDTTAAVKVIEEAVDIVDRTFPDFISHCEQRVAAMMKSF